MRAENCIDYVEIPVTDLNKARDFFAALFGWTFQSYGDDYMSFSDGRMDGGFRRSSEPAPATGVLVVFFSTDLERDFDRVQQFPNLFSRFLVAVDFISSIRQGQSSQSGPDAE